MLALIEICMGVLDDEDGEGVDGLDADDEDEHEELTDLLFGITLEYGQYIVQDLQLSQQRLRQSNSKVFRV